MAATRFGPVAAVLAAACAAAALWLASHHPLSPGFAIAGVAAAVAVTAWRPWLALVLWLGLMPLVDLAPLTGWMLVEEFDLLLLGLAAGAWARLAWPAGLPAPKPRAAGAPNLLWWGTAVLYTAAAACSTWRGLLDAGAWTAQGFDWGWWQGWREPMNVLRTAKPLLGAWLAWGLWRALQSRDPERAARAVGAGGALALAAASLACLWERWAWTGLTNFSTDYRTTALFWETHIGGAALDGCLALTLPCALWAWSVSRGRAQRAAALALLLVAAYAVLTTFSRGLYLGALVGVALWWMTATRPRDADPSGRMHAACAAAWLAAYAVAAAWAFPGSGWRGQIALWGLVALPLLGWRSGDDAGRRRASLLAVGAGAVLGTMAAAGSLALPATWKAPYLLYALAVAVAAVAWLAPPTAGRRRAGWTAWAAAVAAAVAVALHWGPDPATRDTMYGAAGILALGVLAGLLWPRWRGPRGGHWRWPLLGTMAVSSLVVGALAGGRYLETRLSTADEDWHGRLAHWQRALSLPAADGDAAWGIGVGRFAAHFAFSGIATDQTGDYRWQRQPDGGVLVLTGGKHMLGFGELFRMSQRVEVPTGDIRVRWRVRAEVPVRLHAEVCSKHLLYDAGCRTGQAWAGGTPKAPAGAVWTEGGLTLAARGDWQSPVFSVALESSGARIEIDRLEAIDASGRDLLRNGGFDDGLARWLPSSDRHHLPWHAKNIGVHLWVEQGAVGALLFAALVIGALAHLSSAALRRHPLSAPLAAGIVGFLCVGGFDSLLDVPRVAFAFLWLLGVAATLRAPALSPPGPPDLPAGAATTAGRPPSPAPAPAAPA